MRHDMTDYDTVHGAGKPTFTIWSPRQPLKKVRTKTMEQESTTAAVCNVVYCDSLPTVH